MIARGAVPRLEQVLAVGIDYGTTNPTRGLLLGVGTGPDRVRRLYVTDEWAAAANDGQRPVREYARLAGRARAGRAPRTQWVFLDPAAASFRLQLFSDGVHNVAPAHNAVLPGIRTISSLLATELLQVADSCRHLIKYLPGYAWDPKATAKGVDQVLKVDDHEVDALRYAVYSSRALWRDLVPLTAAAVGAPGADELPDAA